MQLDHPAQSPDRPRLPDFIIIGGMRCGSTTLWEMLDRHPGIGFPNEKELHFFDDRDGRWSKGIEWYANQFKGIPPGLICGEATPDYLFHEGACERIAATVPGARLLVILRDPKERVWSHYWHNVRRGREPLTFEMALKAEESRLANPDPAIRSHFSYVERGHFVRRLRQYATLFGRDAIQVIFLEELKNDPETIMRQVCNHLGVQAVPELWEKMTPRRNQTDYPRWPMLSSLTTRMMKGVANTPLLRIPAEAIARATRPLRTYSGMSRMDPRTWETLEEIYQISDRELAEWLGRDVPWAKVERSAAARPLGRA